MRPDRRLQHIEIMDLAESVLQFAQVLGPLFVALRKEILARVAKALDADSQLVIADLRAVSQGLPM